MSREKEPKPSEPQTPIVDGLIRKAADAMSETPWPGWDEAVPNEETLREVEAQWKEAVKETKDQEKS